MPSAVLAVEELTNIPSLLGSPERDADAAIAVCEALARAIDRASDRPVIRALFGMDAGLRASPLGIRREAAAELADVTPGSFRVRREPKLLEDLARALLVELAARPPAWRGGSPSAHLEIDYDLAGASIPLTAARSPVIIGRSSECDIELRDDPSVSRRHAVLSVIDDGWVLEDLGSKNGTFVHGQRVPGPVALRDGDVVLMGQTRMTLHVDRENPATTAPARDIGPTPELSPGELRLLKALVDAWLRDGAAYPRPPTAADLAARLPSSPQAVGAALRRVGRRLGVDGSPREREWHAEVVRKALEHGLVDSEPSEGHHS